MGKKTKKVAKPVKAKTTARARKAAKRAPPTKKAATKKGAKVGRKPTAGGANARLVNFKLPNPEFAKVRKNAKAFAHGNVSAWMRFASVHAKPSPTERKTLAQLTQPKGDE